ncbi:MAG: ATP-binding protein, partial [Planctomycetota bacterium]
IKGGKSFLQMDSYPLLDLVQHALRSMGESLDPFEVVLEISPSLLVFCDSNGLIQILLNLLSNSVKYSKEEKRIVLTAKEEKGWIKIGIQDFGIGIEEKEMELIFDKFYRTLEGEKKAQGLGLGLLISRMLAREMGGNLVALPCEKGAYFEIHLKGGRVSE